MHTSMLCERWHRRLKRELASKTKIRLDHLADALTTAVKESYEENSVTEARNLVEGGCRLQCQHVNHMKAVNAYSHMQSAISRVVEAGRWDIRAIKLGEHQERTHTGWTRLSSVCFHPELSLIITDLPHSRSNFFKRTRQEQAFSARSEKRRMIKGKLRYKSILQGEPNNDIMERITPPTVKLVNKEGKTYTILEFLIPIAEYGFL
ncbi:unnamed protein product [Cylicocyclus nassatus]|uniref:Uncharacterized protein n=1 Tax=Cylicocyclus nassatus TaxID=53992 RepID=A0AA36GLH1_CYLNA|nr:unnamed protein product [Cylicocyclus nassatus]